MAKVLAGFLAIVLSGVALALSLPLFGWSALGFVCLVPALWLARGVGFLRGFLVGIGVTVVAAWISTSPWQPEPALVDGTFNWNYVAFFLFGTVISLFLGIFAEVKTFTWRTVLGLACVGILLEGITFIRMPAQMALSQFANPAALALASVTGIWGVSWLMWLANLAWFAPLASRQRWVAGATVAGLALWGQWGTVQAHARMDEARLVQSHAPIGLVQTPQVGADALLRVQEPLGAVSPRWVVWPEVSVTTFDHDSLRIFARSENGWPIVTSYLDEHQPLPHNAAAVFSKSGTSRPYHKRHPFGDEAKLVTAGTAAQVVAVKSENVGLNICFDSCFPWTMRDTVREGAEVIALPTLDPVSPNGFIQAGHAAFTPFRSAELGVPIVRSEATAWSMVTDASGQITGLLPTGHEGVLARPLPAPRRTTVYRVLGDWFVGAALLGLLLFIPTARRTPKS
jgi:apolipoprotein N-acyltransferase